MKKAVAVIAALAALSTADASAGTYVLRSSGTGVIDAPVAVTPEEPKTPLPETPAGGLALSVVGETSVAVGAPFDLRPVVSGASGSVSYSYSGRLPTGATFDANSGRIAGRALIAGSYEIWVSAKDSSGTAVTAEVVIVVS